MEYESDRACMSVLCSVGDSQDACQNGELDKIKDLIQDGLDVNEADDDG